MDVFLQFGKVLLNVPVGNIQTHFDVVGPLRVARRCQGRLSELNQRRLKSRFDLVYQKHQVLILLLLPLHFFLQTLCFDFGVHDWRGIRQFLHWTAGQGLFVAVGKHLSFFFVLDHFSSDLFFKLPVFLLQPVDSLGQWVHVVIQWVVLFLWLDEGGRDLIEVRNAAFFLDLIEGLLN